MTNEEQAAILSGMALGFEEGIAKEKYDIAMKMAQWKDLEFAKQRQDLIDKAEVLFCMMSVQQDVPVARRNECIEDFRKAMEEPKIIPYRLQCEFAEAVREHGPMVFEVETGYYSTILGTVENQNVQIDCNKITFDALLKFYKWQDGTPCGIME